jgi:hypothetical protein
MDSASCRFSHVTLSLAILGDLILEDVWTPRMTGAYWPRVNPALRVLPVRCGVRWELSSRFAVVRCRVHLP